MKKHLNTIKYLNTISSLVLGALFLFIGALLVLTVTSEKAHAQTLSQVINVSGGKTMTVVTDTRVTYGSGSKWVSKDFKPGTYICNNSTFGSDPNPGVSKRCREVKDVFACYPSQVPGGTGSKGFFMKDATGCIAAWYCQGKEYPVLLVGTPAKCNLSSIGSFIASVAIGEVTKTPAQSNEFLAQNFTANVWTDPTLRAIWIPHIDSIAKMADGYFK